jgi:CO/xanthine dehydrogenase Mo-binding subunit/CO/xanthine dehydrogenase FAD-binding subunit
VNIRRSFRRLWGEVEKARNSVTVSVSGRFWFPQQAHCCMETHRTLAEWREGRLHVWSATASPLPLKMQLAHVLGVPPGQIVIHEVAVGGSFGAKIFITDHEALVAALARKTQRPVWIALTREEEFETTRTRHGFDMQLTLGADSDGKLQLLEGQVRSDSGAYLHAAPSVTSASMIALGLIYDLRGLDVRAQVIDTCKVPAGAMRGYGGPQTTFARECLMDELAEKVGRDPIEFRIQNSLRPDSQGLTAHIGSIGLADCLRAVRQAIGWDREKANRRRGRGVGVATGEHVSGAFSFPEANRCDGVIDLYPDGRVRVRFGGSDAGTGQKTILAQIAAEELGVPLERVSVFSMDTDETAHDFGAWSSRGTHYTGHGIRHTAREFAERLKGMVAERLGGGEIRLEDGFARGERGELALGALAETSADAANGMLTHKASYVDRNVEMMRPDGTGNITATHCYAAHAALIEIDEKTGKVRVLKYVAANDSGTAINPMLVEGQVTGATAMGLGGALAEELLLEQGKVINPAFLHYALPRAADLPRIEPILVGHPDPNGPYGAKAVGEVGVSPPGPAISNAVYDAIGVRIHELPITPDKILTALAAREGRKRAFHLWRRPSRWYIAAVRWAYPLGLLKILHERQMRDQQAPPPPLPIRSVETPRSVAELVGALGPDAAILGGGTDLQLRRRQGLMASPRLISVGRIKEMQQVSVDGGGRLSIGAGVTLSALAEELREKIPAAAQAIDEIASPQIRNVATVAGNLRQEKRCWFFRNGFNCYKRKGGLAPCYAVMGDHRFYHAAIDGHRCQAVTPSDLATVLVALDASVTVRGPRGERVIRLEELYTGPGETAVGDDEVLTQVTIPVEALGRRTAYRKLNLWQGDFAVASAAVSVRVDGSGRCTEARICLGAVAPVPWRARATERALVGQTLSTVTLRRLLDEELNARAHPLSRNEWKLDAVAGLAERAVEELTLVSKPTPVAAEPAVPATV